VPAKKGRPTTKPTGKKIIDAFKLHYDDSHDDIFNPNWGHVVSAEKIASYYSMKDIHDALGYYFSFGGKKDVYDFLKNVDRYVQGSKEAAEKEEYLEKLIESTKEYIEDIEGRPVAEP
jgi:hypothetical protein